VVAGPDRGQTVALGIDSLLIGSAPTCDLVLHDGTVSARHAEILVSRRGYAIRDLESKNGIRCGALTLERCALADGMRLQLGESTIVVRAQADRRVIPLAASGAMGALIAHSVKMRAFAATLQQLAESDIPVLLEGETGTGKELAAQTLHEHSGRRNGPFVVFDCGGVAPTLLAAELFGYEKGAFTGANQARAGVFQDADGGTMFLDEIAELPMALQPLLLGAIDRQSSRRLGGSMRRHDVRIVASTNRSLTEEVRCGRFREDLYFRISAGRIRVPPLRERPDDLPLLADHFAGELGITIAPEIMVAFSSYPWPGNVRELKNAVTRLAIKLEDPIPSGDRVAGPNQVPSLSEARRRAREEFERGYLEDVLGRTGGNVTQAAALAGVSRRFLTRLAAKHGLRVRDRP
jgi:DNA-binding NtrC family response regulator